MFDSRWMRGVINLFFCRLFASYMIFFLSAFVLPFHQHSLWRHPWLRGWRRGKMMLAFFCDDDEDDHDDDDDDVGRITHHRQRRQLDFKTTPNLYNGSTRFNRIIHIYIAYYAIRVFARLSSTSSFKSVHRFHTKTAINSRIYSILCETLCDLPSAPEKYAFVNWRMNDVIIWILISLF